MIIIFIAKSFQFHKKLLPCYPIHIGGTTYATRTSTTDIKQTNRD